LLLRAVELAGTAVGDRAEGEARPQRIRIARTPAPISDGPPHLLPHGLGEKQPRYPAAAIDAQMRQAIGRPAADGAGPAHDTAAIGRVEAGDHVDAGGLAGAVRSHEAEDLARHQVEIDTVEGAEAAEALHQPLDAQQRLALRGHPTPSGAAAT